MRRDFSSLTAYYGQREDLATYTIHTELQRMRYSVVTEDGDRLQPAPAPAPAISIGTGSMAPGHEGTDYGQDRESMKSFLSRRKEHAMVRMANQSIFADMLHVS